MKPIVFAGVLPKHLMSESALEAPRASAHTDYAEQRPVGRFVDVLRGDLNKVTAGQILEAADHLLSAPWNDQPDPAHQGALKLEDAEVTALATRGFKHLQTACADPASPQHWRHWTSRESAFIGAMAGTVANFGCSESLAKLSRQLLADGCTEFSHRLSDGVHAHVRVLHAIDPAKADDYELEAIRSADCYRPRRYGPWADPKSHPEGLPNNEAFAKRALAVMTGRQTSAFIGSCDYDWLSPAQVQTAMETQPNAARSKRFLTATKEQVGKLFNHLVSLGTWGVGNASPVACLREVPAWKEVAADREALRPAFQASPFTQDSGTPQLHLNRVRGLMGVAKSMPAGQSRTLIDEMVMTAVREIAAAPADKVHSTAVGLVDLVSSLGYQDQADVDFVRNLLLQHELLGNPNVCPNGSPVPGGAHGNNLDNEIHRRMKDLGMPPEAITSYRAMFVEAGLVSIGSIRPSDQRKDIIGPALARNPERLAEVTDLERFQDLAQRFAIPVELPVAARPVPPASPKVVDPLPAADAHAPTPTARPRMRV